MYGICKHAILALTEVLAADLLAAGAPIGATGLCPGIIATNLFHGSRNRPAALTEGGSAMSASGARSCAITCTRCCLRGYRRRRWLRCWFPRCGRTQLYLLTDHEWDSRVDRPARGDSGRGRRARRDRDSGPGGRAMSVTYGFAGQVAVITGAANGFGLAVASRLADEGAKLVLVDRDVEAQRGGGFEARRGWQVVADVSDESPGRRVRVRPRWRSSGGSTCSSTTPGSRGGWRR